VAVTHLARLPAVADALALALVRPAEAAVVKFTHLHGQLEALGDAAWALIGTEPTPAPAPAAAGQTESELESEVDAAAAAMGPALVLVERARALLARRRVERSAAAARLLGVRLYHAVDDNDFERAEGILNGADPGRIVNGRRDPHGTLDGDGDDDADAGSSDEGEGKGEGAAAAAAKAAAAVDTAAAAAAAAVAAAEEAERIKSDLKIDEPVSVPGSGGPLTPMQAAAARGNARLVLLLMQYGAAPQQRDPAGRSLLKIALDARQPGVLGALVGCGCPVDRPEDEDQGFTLMHQAAAENDFELCKLLITLRGDVNAKSKKGQTPLMLACARHEPPADPPTPEALEAATAVVARAAEARGESSTVSYAPGDNGAVLRLLLDRGAWPNWRDCDGNTPLHLLTQAVRAQRQNPNAATLTRNGRQRLWEMKKYLCLRGARVAGMRNKRDERPTDDDKTVVAGVVFGLEANGYTDERGALGAVYDYFVKQAPKYKASLSRMEALTNVGPGAGAQHNGGEAIKSKVSRTQWVADNESATCLHCGAEFSFFTRKHHCRVTGALVCGWCSTKELALLDTNDQPSFGRVADCVYNQARRDADAAAYGGEHINILLLPHRNAALGGSAAAHGAGTAVAEPGSAMAVVKQQNKAYGALFE